MKQYKSKFKKCGNKILNRAGHHSVAAVSHEVDNTYSAFFEKDKDVDVGYNSEGINAGLTISDCNRTVTLNFDIFDKEEEINSLHKINSLVKEIEQFRANLLLAIAHRDKHKEIIGKRKKPRDSEGTRISLQKALEIVKEKKDAKSKSSPKRKSPKNRSRRSSKV